MELMLPPATAQQDAARLALKELEKIAQKLQLPNPRTAPAVQPATYPWFRGGHLWRTPQPSFAVAAGLRLWRPLFQAILDGELLRPAVPAACAKAAMVALESPYGGRVLVRDGDTKRADATAW